MSAIDWRATFNRLERYIEERYGIAVRIRDVPHPFTGDLDGAEIHVDFAEGAEDAVFIVAHLFGHTVQWNSCEESREIGRRLFENPTDDQLKALKTYEVEACRYSLQLFHDAGIHELDQWLSDFAACDYRYLEHFYKTGERKDFRSFWLENQPMVTPKPIPDFRPTRWISRWDGVVV